MSWMPDRKNGKMFGSRRIVLETPSGSEDGCSCSFTFRTTECQRWVGGVGVVDTSSAWLAGQAQRAVWTRTPVISSWELLSSEPRAARANSEVRRAARGQWRSLMLFPNICPRCTAGDVKAPVNDGRIYRLAFKREVSIFTAKRRSSSALRAHASVLSSALKTSPSCSSGDSPVWNTGKASRFNLLCRTGLSVPCVLADPASGVKGNLFWPR